MWKARSSLELLDLFGDRITRGELDRFFEIARQILFAPDPEFELPDEKRYAAQIYGKVRPQSSILIQAICNTLVKLAVRGPHVPALSATNIGDRINAFVRELLHDADNTHWLSISSLLPSLAEAAPDAFLNAVEVSLARPDMPVTRLIRETKCSSLMGRCWHAGLLWALGFEGEQCAKSLYDAIMSNPRLFTELLCIRYKQASGKREEPLSEDWIHASKKIFFSCKGIIKSLSPKVHPAS